MPIYISIGIDCSMGECLRNLNIRSFSGPFDWLVSYAGVSRCIQDEFCQFVPERGSSINNYDFYFHHDFCTNTSATFEEDERKYARRIERVLELFSSCNQGKKNETIVFCRAGHGAHHHGEQNCAYNTIVQAELEELVNLEQTLRAKYANLSFEIHYFPRCPQCASTNTTIRRSETTTEDTAIVIHDCVGKELHQVAKSVFVN